jgi:SAM-dependent methyltransferase
MTDTTSNTRFGFGKNWHTFVTKDFTAERAGAAKAHLLKFFGGVSLKGKRFLDIGCGSGIHSLGAYTEEVSELLGFDYDPDSVAATKILRDTVGQHPDRPWVVEQGDVLDKQYLARLGQWDIVYSWGVLHHTGSMWEAIRNVLPLVAPGGYLYIALYSKDSCTEQEFWIQTKQRYNQSSPLKRRMMGWWYVWKYIMNRNPLRFPEFLIRMYKYRFIRGMSLMRDIHDWIGGWPMEYAGDQETISLIEPEGFRLIKLGTGHACTEFLFQKGEAPATISNAKTFPNKFDYSA